MVVRKTRNDSDFWFCQFNPDVEYRVIDEYGNETGDTIPDYGEVQPFWANVSPGTGAAQFEQFFS